MPNWSPALGPCSVPGPREFVPPESIPGVIRDRVVLRAATFLIDRPGDMEELMDLPSVRSAFMADEYLPYWADVWPAARMLARRCWRRIGRRG